eukprot:3392790-Rhodomonas_salina.1
MSVSLSLSLSLPFHANQLAVCLPTWRPIFLPSVLPARLPSLPNLPHLVPQGWIALALAYLQALPQHV